MMASLNYRITETFQMKTSHKCRRVLAQRCLWCWVGWVPLPQRAVRESRSSLDKRRPPLTGQECYQDPSSQQEEEISNLKKKPQTAVCCITLSAPPHSGRLPGCYLNQSLSSLLTAAFTDSSRERPAVIETDRPTRTLNLLSNEKC